MANERWNSPFPHTIAFVLFKEHFTELNNVYWAHVPAASTIEKKALEALKSEDADPKRYFLIPDRDDRRMAQTYGQWKSFYREFSNYTRLNMLWPAPMPSPGGCAKPGTPTTFMPTINRGSPRDMFPTEGMRTGSLNACWMLDENHNCP